MDLLDSPRRGLQALPAARAGGCSSCRPAAARRADPEHLLPALGNLVTDAREAGPEDAPVEPTRRPEHRAILEALERTGGHRERAARLRGISVRTLYDRLEQYGIR